MKIVKNKKAICHSVVEGELVTKNGNNYLFYEDIDTYLALCGEKGCNNMACRIENPRCKSHAGYGRYFCKEPGCGKNASYGVIGTKVRLFCAAHHDITKHVSLNKSRKNPNAKKAPRCITEGCNEIAHFKIKGENNRILCKTHRTKGYHVNYKKPYCIDVKCTTIATFGIRGTNKPIFCGTHRDKSIHVDLCHKLCDYPGCETRPTFGIRGTKTPLSCVEHMNDNYIDVLNINKMCTYQGCEKHASFGLLDTSKPLFCADHKDEKIHVNIVSDRCQQCDRLANFGIKGTKIGLFCEIHKEDEHINVKAKRCDSCKEPAYYGLLFQKATHCIKHRTKNEFFKRYPRCCEEECKNLPTHTDDNTNYPQRCEEHSIPGDVNIIEKECSKCHLMYHILSTRKLCNYCFDYKEKKVHKAKEQRIDNLLTANSFDFYIRDKRIDGGCYDDRDRPDFLIPKMSFMIIVEVDENQHKSRLKGCELDRMINIYFTLGGIRTIFVRYNPDGYTGENGKRCHSDTTREHNLMKLLKYIEKSYSENETDENLSVYYMYYDGWNGTALKKEIDVYNRCFIGH